MPKKVEMELTVLEDGTVSVSTGDMSGENHLSADQMIKELQKLLGGVTVVKSTKEHLHKHEHKHGEGHQHL